MKREQGTLLAAFALSLRAERKEESTILLYVNALEGLLARLEGSGGIAAATPSDLLRYREALLASGMKRATINKRMSIARSFFHWAGREGLANPDVADGLRLEADAAPPVRWLSEPEERALLEAASTDGNSERSVRNAALVAAMLYAGLRVKEVSALRLDALRHARLIVHDDDGVGDSPARVVPLEDDRAIVPLARWRAHRLASIHAKHKESLRFFVTERSGMMQPRAVQFAVESLSAKAGFPVRCSELRHTYCRRLAAQGASVERVRDWAGHKSAQTTLRYFEGLEGRTGNHRRGSDEPRDD